ncbi:hypothetical protein [Komagataeibacter xylinus]|uniref:Uncharacterized protein n=1 Tax=Komagataeibacter xylinus TaxID=28448 RepID=A0A857FQU3_KOMXY|nr:hypothetical protein [Komagataeibacter xylinus]QHC36536.1 hypothetical protein FMA36_14410 [Komagataeibacter xylinus]
MLLADRADGTEELIADRGYDSNWMICTRRNTPRIIQRAQAVPLASMPPVQMQYSPPFRAILVMSKYHRSHALQTQ